MNSIFFSLMRRTELKNQVTINTQKQLTAAICLKFEQLIRCSKVTVFFIDDKQNVRSREIGSSDLIRQAAYKFQCQLSEVNLLTQYRCMGSNDYLQWIESVWGSRINDAFCKRMRSSTSA